MTTPKLLLADDSATIRKVVELTFADEGIDVSTAADANSAMLKFVEIQPDIVLVDVGLQGTNGYQMCEMIKQDEATKHIPVVLLVGSFEPFDQDEAERCGADAFLTKPFHSIRDLVGNVWDLLGGPPEKKSAEPEDSTEKVSPDVADIENLYQDSFAETVEIDQFDTADDMFGHSEMDDDMIEASYPTEAYAANLADLIPDSRETGETKEFDWSPESMVTEMPAETTREFAAVDEQKPAFEPKFVFAEEPGTEVMGGAEVNTTAVNNNEALEFNLKADVRSQADGEVVEPPNEAIEGADSLEIVSGDESFRNHEEKEEWSSPFVGSGEDLSAVAAENLSNGDEPDHSKYQPSEGFPIPPSEAAFDSDLINDSHTESRLPEQAGTESSSEETTDILQPTSEVASEDEGSVLDLHISYPRVSDLREDRPLELDAFDSRDFLSDLFSESAQADINLQSEAASYPVGAGVTKKIHDDIHDEETSGGTSFSEADDTPFAAESNAGEPGFHNPSSEYIEMIAQRVIEHLSDRVIREVARDVVPRVAEKLIREALDGERKV